MNRADLEGLRNFEKVWQRIQRNKQVQAEGGRWGVEALMDGLHFCQVGCRKMAAFTDGTEKNRLIELSEQIKKQYDRLQLHYFLKNGDIHNCKVMCDFASYTPYNLRKLWQSTVQNEELLKKCNLNEGDNMIAELHEVETALIAHRLELERLIGALLR